MSASACGCSLATAKRRIAKAESSFEDKARTHPVLREWVEKRDAMGEPERDLNELLRAVALEQDERLQREGAPRERRRRIVELAEERGLVSRPGRTTGAGAVAATLPRLAHGPRLAPRAAAAVAMLAVAAGVVFWLVRPPISTLAGPARATLLERSDAVTMRAFAAADDPLAARVAARRYLDRHPDGRDAAAARILSGE